MLDVCQNGSHLFLASVFQGLLLESINLVAEGGELRGSHEEVSVGVDGQCIREVAVPSVLAEKRHYQLHIVHASIIFTLARLRPSSADTSL